VEWLAGEGFNTWIDCKNLLPGQDFDFEITRALDKSSIVIAFVSNNSFNRRGYLQRELKRALDKMKEHLVDDIYLIPVLLDTDVEVPHELKHLHFIVANESDFRTKLGDSLKYQMGRLGLEQSRTQRREDIYWTSRTVRESWDGLPGYSVELELLELRSDRYKNIGEIGDYLKGVFLESLFRHRSQKFDQSPDFFNYAQEPYSRTNTYDAHCRGPVIKGRILTVQYAIHWYGAGAIHPNHHFQTYSFLLDPLTLIAPLQGVFVDETVALPIIQAEARRQLVEALARNHASDGEPSVNTDWVNRGTVTWDDFNSFVFGPEGLELLFAPYHVASYADGSQLAVITYDTLKPFLRSEYIIGLQLQR